MVKKADKNLLPAKRFAIYIRKSTDDPKKQVRSVEDQIEECLGIAKQKEIKVREEDIIVDSRSGRYSGNRPKFENLIGNIRKGKIDGLISWHPDRLARNMKEAGEIIDLLDLKLLKELHFSAHNFVNDYNGVMALGICFVIAKQYSDKLGVDVTRGMRHAHQEGKSGGQYKPGYIRSEYVGFYEPDETDRGYGYTQFELIQKAWRMRLDGKTLAEIVQFLNDHGYIRVLKKKDSKMRKEQPMSDEKLSNMFNDRFYLGILEQAGEEIDLREVDPNFVEMIEEGEWLLVQEMGRKREEKKARYEYPFRGLLVCVYCDRNMSIAASKGNHNEWYLNAWCQNKKKYGCPSKGTIRGKAILEALGAIYDIFGSLSEADYEKYIRNFEEKKTQKNEVFISQLAPLGKTKRSLERQLDELIANVLPREKDLDAKSREVYHKERGRLEEKIEKCKLKEKELRDGIREEPLDYKTLLNFLKSLSTSLKFGSVTVKDHLARNTVLNFIVKDKEIAEVKLKEPFASCVNRSLIKDGGPAWT